MRVHLDTDFGGDPDDACALVMLLGWPGVDIVGITTNLEVSGRRAGCVSRYLGIAHRHDIPVAAGAQSSMTTGAQHAPTWGDTAHWPDPVGVRPGPVGAALDLLAESISVGATIVAIGALTNLAMLELERPGILADASVVVMGGWVSPPAPGLPAWGPEHDWNLQCDTKAAAIALSAIGELTLVTLPAAMRAHLRDADLPRLRSSGPLGTLLARQSAAHATYQGMAALGRSHEGLPDDLVNYHWDPVTAAVAVGWQHATCELQHLRVGGEGSTSLLQADPAGRLATVVLDVEGGQFGEDFLAMVECADRLVRKRAGTA